MSYSFRDSEILSFIELVQDSVPNAIEVFTKGNCTSFALMLATAFPGGRVLHNIDHAVYEYNGFEYDITGHVSLENGMRIEEYGVLEIKNFLKNNYRK